MTEVLDPSEIFPNRFGRYSIVPWAHGHEVLIYQEYGSYQGEWLSMAKTDSFYSLWRGSYGSCSGCDSWEADISYSDVDEQKLTRRKSLEFSWIADERSFIEIPFLTMKNLCTSRKLAEIFPAKFHEHWSDLPPVEDIAADCMLVAKLDQGWELTVDDILKAPNAELRQRGLKLFGFERFRDEAHMEIIHKDGPNCLLSKGNIRMLYLKDSSTDRRYLLGVPSTIARVRQGIAWTFGKEEEDYNPNMET